VRKEGGERRDILKRGMRSEEKETGKRREELREEKGK
jgi:hypothetical protein